MSWTKESSASIAEELRRAKQSMIQRHLKGRDIQDHRVLEAMERVPREKFVDPEYIHSAYSDCPLPIGGGQTISQPYIVALMAQILQINPGDKVLEIGCGCGYQAAVLSLLAQHVYTIEIIEHLALEARARLSALGYSNVTVIHADGTYGWPEYAPYDRIIVAATFRKIPKTLENQLIEGGRITLPLGNYLMQDLVLGKKSGGRINYQTVTLVRFVPMTGEAQDL